MASVCKVYSYVMVRQAPTFENILWTCEGRVMFQGSARTTGWHGSCVEGVEGPFRTTQLRFHFNNREERYWRTTNVIEVSPGVFRGRDYRGREIEMRLLATYVYQPGARDHDTETGWILIA